MNTDPQHHAIMQLREGLTLSTRLFDEYKEAQESYTAARVYEARTQGVLLGGVIMSLIVGLSYHFGIWQVVCQGG